VAVRSEIDVTAGAMARIALVLPAAPVTAVRLAGPVTEDVDVMLVTAKAERDVTGAARAGAGVRVPAAAPFAWRVRHGDRTSVIDGVLDATNVLSIPTAVTVSARFARPDGRPADGWAELTTSPVLGDDDRLDLGDSSPAPAVSLATTSRVALWLHAVPADPTLRGRRVRVHPGRARDEALDLGALRFTERNGPLLTVLLPGERPADGAILERPDGFEWLSCVLDAAGGYDPAVADLDADDVVRVIPDDPALAPLRAVLEGPGPWLLDWPSGVVDLRMTASDGAVPAAARVLVDGREVAVAGGHIRLSGMPAGENDVVALAPGYRPRVVRYRLGAGETRSLAVALQPLR